MNNYIHILPCPFCGDEVKDKPLMSHAKQSKHHDVHYKIYCSNCGAGPNYYCSTEQEAIIVWNTRPSFSANNEFICGFEEAKRKISMMIQKINGEKNEK